MKKHLLIYLIVVFVVPLITSSCIVVNLTKGKTCPDYCDKHHALTGKTAIVRTRYGKLHSNGYAYPFAKKTMYDGTPNITCQKCGLKSKHLQYMPLERQSFCIANAQKHFIFVINLRYKIALSRTSS